MSALERGNYEDIRSSSDIFKELMKNLKVIAEGRMSILVFDG